MLAMTLQSVTVDTALDRVRLAAEAKNTTETELTEAIRAAREAGDSLRSIADAAGLSHQRVYQIVGPRRPAE